MRKRPHRMLWVGVVGCLLALGACSGSASSTAPTEPTRDSAPTSDELCALITDEDFPGDEFRLVAHSGSIAADGRIRHEFVPADDPTADDGFVAAAASCSWLGQAGDTLSVLVIDREAAPTGFDGPVGGLLPGTRLDAHGLYEIEGYDELAVASPSPGLTFVGAEAGSFVVLANASILSAAGESDRLLELVLVGWLELARR